MEPASSISSAPSTPARLYCLLVGGVLVVGGIGGYFYESSFGTGESLRSGEALGAFEVNGWHNLAHLATGAALLIAAGAVARPAALLAGAGYVLLALMGFVATGAEGLDFVAERDVLFEALPVNDADNVLHLVLGLAGVAATMTTPKRGRGAG